MGDESGAGRGAVVPPSSLCSPAGVTPCIWSQKMEGRWHTPTALKSSPGDRHRSLHRPAAANSLTAPDSCHWTVRPQLFASRFSRDLVIDTHAEPENHAVSVETDHSVSRLCSRQKDSVCCCSSAAELTHIHSWGLRFIKWNVLCGWPTGGYSITCGLSCFCFFFFWQLGFCCCHLFKKTFLKR